MTRPASNVPAPPADAAAALARVRDHGGRLTAGKRALIELLFEEGPSPTADEIVSRLTSHDRSAIYRNLAQFEALGIVEHVHLGHGPAVYRRTGSPTVPVTCVQCGHTVELARRRVDGFARLVGSDTGIEIDLTHFPLTGTCAPCRAARR